MTESRGENGATEHGAVGRSPTGSDELERDGGSVADDGESDRPEGQRMASEHRELLVTPLDEGASSNAAHHEPASEKDRELWLEASYRSEHGGLSDRSQAEQPDEV